MSHVWTVSVGLAVVVVAYFALGLGKPEYCGPLSEDWVRRGLRFGVYLRHVLAAALAAAAGVVLTTHRWFYVSDLVAAFLGLPAGILWGHFRLRKAVITRAGPDASVPEEKLFPSDHLARLLHEGCAPPLAAWVDLVVLLACAGIGSLVGLTLDALVFRVH